MAIDVQMIGGSVALEQGKRVFYVTHVGVFRLTPKGLLLEQVDAFLNELPPWQHLVQHRTAGGWAALLIQRTGNA